MICPNCKSEYSDDEKFCYNCGTRLVTKTNIVGKQQQEKIKSFYPWLVLILIAISIIILWNPIYHIILNPQPASTPTPQFNLDRSYYTTTAIPTPQPTLTDTYNFNEPATDGNLQLTVLKSWDGDRTSGYNKEFYIQLKMQNLRVDKTIQILDEDFLFIDNIGGQYPSGQYDLEHSITIFDSYGMICGNSFRKCDLGTNQWGTYQVKVIIPQSSQGLKLRFNFGGPSGTGPNGPFIYFNVNPNLSPTPTLIPPTPTAPPISYIRINGASCIPETLNIKAGTMVEWRNEDTFWYTIASESGNAPTTIGQLPAGQTLSYTFSKLGRTIISFYDPQSQNRKVCYIIVT